MKPITTREWLCLAIVALLAINASFAQVTTAPEITGAGTISATQITAGTLAVARGGTNIASYSVGDILYATGGTTLAKLADVATGNVLLSGGVGAAPAYGKVALSALATQATNTVVGNATNGSAAPTALAVGSCSTAGSALIWTTDSGFGCNTAIAASTATTATNLGDNVNSLKSTSTSPDVRLKNTASATQGAGGVRWYESDDGLAWGIEINSTVGAGLEINQGATNRAYFPPGGGMQVANGGSANKAICWKADAVTLGYCSSVVGAGGDCTCN